MSRSLSQDEHARKTICRLGASDIGRFTFHPSGRPDQFSADIYSVEWDVGPWSADRSFLLQCHYSWPEWESK